MSQRSKIPFWHDCGKTDPFHTLLVEIFISTISVKENLVTTCKKSQMQIDFDPVIPVLEVYHTDTFAGQVQIVTPTRFLSTAL